jgi:hypothetical protein
MARTSAPPSDLEIEDPDGRSPGSGPSQRPTLKRSRLLLIIAVVAAVLAVAFPFRSQFNRSEAGRLQRRWIEAISLDRARSGDLTASISRAPPETGPRFTRRPPACTTRRQLHWIRFAVPCMAK